MTAPRMSKASVESFSAWLARHGAEVLPLTDNEWEVLRFRCAHGTGVVYKNKQGTYSPNCDWVYDAFSKFKSSKGWSGFLPKPKRRTKRTHKDSLIARDGYGCFYCGKQFRKTELTREHILSVNHGGPTRLENMVLACHACNQLAEALPIVEKIALRDRLRTEK